MLIVGGCSKPNELMCSNKVLRLNVRRTLENSVTVDVKSVAEMQIGRRGPAVFHFGER